MYHLVRTLRLTLPPPPADSEEDLTQRDHSAVARIASLGPANEAEADLAAAFVAASEQWKDCLREARNPQAFPGIRAGYRAQAAMMMRQSLSALRTLLHAQAARLKVEANAAARNRAVQAEQRAAHLMLAAIHPAAPAALPPTA
jgi:hypothetical protein